MPSPVVSPTSMQASRVSLERPHVTTWGLILADFDFLPVYVNDAAVDIMRRFSEANEMSEWETFVQKQLQIIFGTARYSADSSAFGSFISGKRRYTWRASVLDTRDDTRPSLIAFVMDRQVVPETGLREASRRYHLSPREYETVVHLSHGLTTKEIAQRMSVSPNTVKQFVRLTMSKMRVTTRSGVLGKILSA
jgi:DNA-binding CsgD family transcriptional regulator